MYSASAILAEIGDDRIFADGENPAAWCGLTPEVSRSANMRASGGIIEQKSKQEVRMLVLV